MTSFLEKIESNIREMRRVRIEFCRKRRQASEYQRQEFNVWRSSSEAYDLIVFQLEKLGYICPICQQDLNETNATIDHLFPLSRAYHKAMDTSNFLVMCHRCNKKKYNTPFQQWRGQLARYQKNSLDYAIQLIHGKTKLQELIGSSSEP
ncbi:HNH endonuclease [Lusitaniella coriacea LEGE 07157]|uniref:HNH endonuclease n=1 Tax=Lusitaniella coriacea LEGE 07157 TaxID=945747 RepID=A0A8J7DWX2_9CYAN|nr:HNH endonuclease [Lusitaniella coriacea]MBE9116607.1 HNH endonuclease [Lusitaniella coriacea LEGE 07157]